MGDMIPFLIFGVVITLVIGGVIWSHFAEKKRREQLAEAATEMGLSFFPDGNSDLLMQLQSFKLFNRGRAKKMRNLIQGDSGEVKIAIFDYQFTTGSGKNSHTHRMSLAVLQSNQLKCPDFTMRPEGMFDKIGSAMGYQDIDFETHPEYSKLFVLQSSDEDAVRNFFKPSLLEFFEAKKGVSVEAQPGMMFFQRPGRRVKAEQLKDLLGEAYEVFGQMVDQA